MRIALKEWAVVVDALERGEQDILLRKGGIAEGRGGFQPGHPRFWLFPTRFHQQKTQVIAPAQARFDVLEPTLPPEDLVRISSWAAVIASRRLNSLAEVAALRARHIWRDEVIAERFQWGRESGIYALELRVHKLDRPWTGPLRPEYGGCKSWVELAEVPAPIPESPMNMIL